VEMESVLPPSVTVVQLQSSQGTATNAGGTVRVELGTLPSGATAEVSMVILPHQSGALSTAARVTSDAVDTAPDDNATTLITTVQPLADLLIQQQASAAVVLVNGRLTFTIRVTPVAPYAVPQTVLTDSLPDWADLVSATTSQGTLANRPGIVMCDFGVIPKGETATVAITVAPRVPGAATNLAVVASPYADPAGTNHTSTLSVMVTEPFVLNFERSQNKLLLWWPLSAQDFVLEVTDRLVPPVIWSEEKNTPELEGDRMTVTIKRSTGARYYRLRTP